MNLELVEQLKIADPEFITEKTHVDPRNRSFRFEGGVLLFRHGGQPWAYSFNGVQTNERALFFALVDRIKERGWYFSLGFGALAGYQHHAHIDVPSNQEVRLQGVPVKQTARVCGSGLNCQSELEALVRAYINACKAVRNDP